MNLTGGPTEGLGGHEEKKGQGNPGLPLYSTGDEPACAVVVCRPNGTSRQGCDVRGPQDLCAQVQQ